MLILDSIAKAIASVSDNLKPWIEDHFQQKYDNEHISRIREFNSIMAKVGKPDFDDDLDDFMLHLVTEGGDAIGQVDGRTIRVPLDYFETVVKGYSKGIRDSKINSKIQFKQG